MIVVPAVRYMPKAMCRAPASEMKERTSFVDSVFPEAAGPRPCQAMGLAMASYARMYVCMCIYIYV